MSWTSTKWNFFLLFSFFVCKKQRKKSFFRKIPAILKCLDEFIAWCSGNSYCRTKSKTLCFICFRWSFMEKSSTQATYLLFEDLRFLDIFVYKICVKSIKNNFSLILNFYLLSPTSFISIFILATSKEILKNSLFLGEGRLESVFFSAYLSSKQYWKRVCESLFLNDNVWSWNWWLIIRCTIKRIGIAWTSFAQNLFSIQKTHKNKLKSVIRH